MRSVTCKTDISQSKTDISQSKTDISQFYRGLFVDVVIEGVVVIVRQVALPLSDLAPGARVQLLGDAPP